MKLQASAAALARQTTATPTLTALISSPRRGPKAATTTAPSAGKAIKVSSR